MSRRRLIHGKMAREILTIFKPPRTQPILIAVRGNVEKWRNERGIKPHGLR